MSDLYLTDQAVVARMLAGDEAADRGHARRAGRLESLSAASGDRPDEGLRRGELARLVRVTLDSLPDRMRRVRAAVHTEWRQETRTRSRRVMVRWSLGAVAAAALAFVRSHCPAYQELVPQAWIDYRRITLLNARTAERVTIDLELHMSRGGRQRSLRDVAVVEVKQSRLDRDTAVMRALRSAGWRHGWVSKYCAGVALTSPEVRANRLLVGLRALKAVGTWAS